MPRHPRRRRSRIDAENENVTATPTPTRRTRRNMNIDRDSGTTPSSIRDGAERASQSSGSYNGRSYGLSYRSERSQQSYPTCNGGCADKYNCDVCDKKRICVCAQHAMPYDCEECICAIPVGDAVGIACNKHQLVECTSLECNDMFHIQCVAHLRHVTVEVFTETHLQNFVCHRCRHLSSSQNHLPWESRTPLYPEKLIRCGLAESNMTGTRRSRTNILKEASDAYSKLNRCSISKNLLQYTPKSYVPLVNMDPTICEQHAVMGRRFEMSMFSFEVTRCHCCGISKPQHQDVLFPKEHILEQTMFVTKMHDAMHCKCDGICNGSQFYSIDKPKQMTFYKQHHGDLLPTQFLGLEPGFVNALLCKECDKEISHRNVEGMLFMFGFVMYCLLQFDLK